MCCSYHFCEVHDCIGGCSVKLVLTLTRKKFSGIERCAVPRVRTPGDKDSFGAPNPVRYMAALMQRMRWE